MPQVAVLTDSIACLNRELARQYNVGILPINFYAGGKLYHDWVDIMPSEAYQLFLREPDSFKSSAPSPEDIGNAFRLALQQARDLLVIAVSSKLSSVASAATLIGEQIMREMHGHQIEVIDSRTATAAEGLIAMAAARAAFLDKSLPEVKDAALSVQKRVGCYILLDTIKHVYRTGRVPRVVAQVGSVLNIKPILTLSNGAVEFVGAVRDRAHGFERIVDLMRQKVGEAPIRVAVMHAYDEEGAARLKEHVSKEFSCVDVWVSEFSPVMGYATGTGTLGLAFHTERLLCEDLG